MKKILLICALLGAVVSCIDKDYDYQDGFDKSMTLFGEEMVLPMGKMDSISIESFLKDNGIDFSKKDKDGYYCYEQSKDCFSLSGLQIAYMKQSEYTQKNFTLNVTKSTNIVESSMSLAGQQATFIFNNPFEGGDIAISFDVEATTSNGTTVKLGSLTKQACPPGETDVTMSLEAVGGSVPSSISIKNIKMYVPESISESAASDVFKSFTTKVKYHTGFAMPNVENMVYTFPVEDIDQDVAKYKFTEIELNSEIVSTIPVYAKVHEFYLVDKEGNKFDDLSLTTSPEYVSPGTMAQPVTTKFKAIVKTSTGIPDLKKIFISFDITTDKDMAAGVAMNVNQCCVMNNSSIILRGGITVCGN